MTSDIFASMSPQERKESIFTVARDKHGYAQCINPKCRQWNVLPNCYGKCGNCIEEAAQLAAVARHKRDQAWEAQWKEPKASRIKGVRENVEYDRFVSLRDLQ